ncbi:MAG: class I tRNA ligase family protein, partial [Terrimicrobiaceae bacterium]|nr:class I tRNA ligase family protein [Terrimicrobiaceae bacterium]
PRIVEILRSRGALLAHGEFVHSYPHCWRSKTPVIFRAIEQFFIRIDELRGQALEAIAATEWMPAWGMTRIRDTVAARPDWCISRQRAWGVPLPVFYDPQGRPILDPAVIEKVAQVVARKGTNAWFELGDREWAGLVGLPPDVTRRHDTLDVWIDSGVSHQAVLKQHPALAFPADLYLEATDQHRGWFQSSLLTSVAIEGRAPYRKVLTHGFVVDVDTRKKLSKSAQGGYTKPTEASHFVEKYGADLVRLWVSSVTATDDVPFSEEIFSRLGDSYRRIRNTLRILLANGGSRLEASSGAGCPTLVDRWVLARLDEVAAVVRDAFARLEFHRVFRALNDFCAVELSSLYVDITKDRLYCDLADSPRRLATRAAMRTLFDHLCRMLAPILAFTAEEAWSHFAPGTSVHLELLPSPGAHSDPAALSLMEHALEARQAVTRALESAQKSGQIGSALEASVRLRLPPGPLLDFSRSHPGEIEELFILSSLEIEEGTELHAEAAKSPHPK